MQNERQLWKIVKSNIMEKIKNKSLVQLIFLLFMISTMKSYSQEECIPFNYSDSIYHIGQCKPLDLKLTFNDNELSQTITEHNTQVLDEFYQFLHRNPKLVIDIHVYVSRKGNKSNNLKIANSIGKGIIDYLIDKGINTERLSAKSFIQKDKFNTPLVNMYIVGI